MAAKNKSKKYTVSDVYKEAASMLKDEMLNIKNRPLTESEEQKMKELGKLISKTVLREMKII
jgi:hypothetical protein